MDIGEHEPDEFTQRCFMVLNCLDNLRKEDKIAVLDEVRDQIMQHEEDSD